MIKKIVKEDVEYKLSSKTTLIFNESGAQIIQDQSVDGIKTIYLSHDTLEKLIGILQRPGGF